MNDFRDKNIIITGAGRGLGKAIADRLTQENAKVIAFDKYFKNSSEYHQKVAVDFSNFVLLKKKIQNTINKNKVIHGLVNCAGITLPQKSNNDKLFNNWTRTIDINLNSVYLFCLLILDNFVKKKTRGKIINFSSIGGQQGFPENPSYCSSKGGIQQLTKSLAVDYGRFGIRVNNIVPGYFKTPMNKKSLKSKEKVSARSNNTCLGRWGEPLEIVEPTLFLLSDSSSYITGSDLIVDGGWLAKGM